MDFLTHLSPWHWWALAIVFLAIEIVAPSAYFLWPAVAAAVVGVVLWFAPHVGLLGQSLVFGVLAITALAVWHVVVGRRQRAVAGLRLNQRAAQYIGRRASVVQGFKNGRGEVELDDTRWPAEAADGADIEMGASVKIDAVEGTLLKVSRHAQAA
jgi:membrane protein implicated in regulation of membrane protease activity